MNTQRICPRLWFPYEARDFPVSTQEAWEAFESSQAFRIFVCFDAEQVAFSTVLLNIASYVWDVLWCLGVQGSPLLFSPVITISTGWWT